MEMAVDPLCFLFAACFSLQPLSPSAPHLPLGSQPAPLLRLMEEPVLYQLQRCSGTTVHASLRGGHFWLSFHSGV